MSKWPANGGDHSQATAGKVMVVCDCYHATNIKILSKLVLGFISKENPLYRKKAILFTSEAYKFFHI